jgi:hypothetical protein
MFRLDDDPFFQSVPNFQGTFTKMRNLRVFYSRTLVSAIAGVIAKFLADPTLGENFYMCLYVALDEPVIRLTKQNSAVMHVVIPHSMQFA